MPKWPNKKSVKMTRTSIGHDMHGEEVRRDDMAEEPGRGEMAVVAKMESPRGSRGSRGRWPSRPGRPTPARMAPVTLAELACSATWSSPTTSLCSASRLAASTPDSAKLSELISSARGSAPRKTQPLDAKDTDHHRRAHGQRPRRAPDQGLQPLAELLERCHRTVRRPTMH